VQPCLLLRLGVLLVAVALLALQLLLAHSTSQPLTAPPRFACCVQFSIVVLHSQVAAFKAHHYYGKQGDSSLSREYTRRLATEFSDLSKARESWNFACVPWFFVAPVLLVTRVRPAAYRDDRCCVAMCRHHLSPQSSHALVPKTSAPHESKRPKLTSSSSSVVHSRSRSTTAPPSTCACMRARSVSARFWREGSGVRLFSWA
jgi:hypothetical protein